MCRPSDYKFPTTGKNAWTTVTAYVEVESDNKFSHWDRSTDDFGFNTKGGW